MISLKIVITKSKFNSLSLNLKGEYLFQEGEYIATREYYNYRINLYLLNDFFVEVWYSPCKNRIEKIEILESEKTLDLYIDQMNESGNNLRLYFIRNIK